MDYLIVFTALLPVMILLYYIYRKDSLCPEPTGQMVKAFLLGAVSAPLSLCISLPLEALGFFTDDVYTVADSVRCAFWGAAIPEEAAKLLILWLLLRRNRYFDENMDGIVYAVCVSLGFAAVENVEYLFSNYDSFLAVGFSRAIFSVPAHFCFGIIMGYYYSLAVFSPASSLRNRLSVYLAPVLAHGLFDSVLFISTVAPSIGLLLLILFLYLCHKLWKFSSSRIREHLQRDQEGREKEGDVI